MDWTTLVSGLTLAAISGMSFVAYKHPKPFKRIGIALSLLIIGGVAALIIFDAGRLRGFYLVEPMIPAGKLETARETLSAEHGAGFPFLMGGLGLLFYVQLLTWLPDMLGRNDDKEP